jgi:hypothetical protein
MDTMKAQPLDVQPSASNPDVHNIPINIALGVVEGLGVNPYGQSGDFSRKETLSVEDVGRGLGGFVTGKAVVSGEYSARLWLQEHPSRRNDPEIGFTGKQRNVDVGFGSGFEIQSPEKKIGPNKGRALSRTFHQSTTVKALGNLMDVDYDVMDKAVEDGVELSSRRQAVIAQLDRARAHGGETGDSLATGRIDEGRWVRTKDRTSGETTLESALARTAYMSENGRVTVSQEYANKNGDKEERVWTGEKANRIANAMARRAREAAQNKGAMSDREMQRRINIERAREVSARKKK